MNTLFWEKQGWHALALVVLLAGVGWQVAVNPAVTAGSLWGLGTTFWLWLAVAVPVAHQLYVWLVWRTALRSDWATGTFGKRAFVPYKAGFFVLFAGRLVSIVLLGLANRDTVAVPYIGLVVVALLLTPPMLYLGYSVVRFFGIDRAAGADHFFTAYRSKPMETRGIYKYTSNGMYTFGFLPLWIVALLTASQGALLVALFSHLYIWVHYLTVEAPDMRRIYGAPDES